MPSDISSLQQLVAQLLQRVEELEAENKLLRSQLNMNSRNSNKPPSSEGLRKKPALPKEKKGKQGGQPGHKGITLQFSTAPDTVLGLKAQSCNCGASLENMHHTFIDKRQVFDLPQPKLEVTEYRRYGCNCPKCGKSVTVDFPKHIGAPLQYGSGVKALSTMLNVHYKMPYQKISLLFQDLFGIPINESTIFSGNQDCCLKLEPIEQSIKEHLINSELVHYDETGIRVEGRLHWLHCCANSGFTYLFAHDKRGTHALESSASLLPHSQGWAVHDCWQSYFKHEGCKHVLCGAHLLRELTGLDEAGSSWAKRFKDYLMELYHLSQKGTRALDEKQKQKALQDYHSIYEYANRLEPPRSKPEKGRPKATPGRNLLDRLYKHKEGVLAFAFHQIVPFTNNLAERDLRPVKVKQKIAGCFRTLKGARIYARIEGFVSTMRKQGIAVLDAFRKVIEEKFDNNVLKFYPS